MISIIENLAEVDVMIQCRVRSVSPRLQRLEQALQWAACH